jgi:hypothetical protein
MKPESEPVADDEFVLRFVWHAFFRPGAELCVLPRAFHPRDDETTGISVYRVACLDRPADVLSVIAPEKRNSYYLAALAVADLRSLAITVVPDPIPEVRGHALLSEVNSTAVAADKGKWKPILEALARLASRNMIPIPSPGS